VRQTMVALSTIQHMVSFSTIVRRARVHAQARLDLAMKDTRAQVPGLLYVPSQRLEASLRQRTRATQNRCSCGLSKNSRSYMSNYSNS
jgi:hypothetical protein